MSQIEINQPLVSVIVLVYNHEKYIADALDGILMQKVNFDYEIILGEDCSTDKSREIIFKYAQKYPDKFKLLLHKHNIGAIANQINALSACTGKFIAFCEGDDYWTDPLKLQKQVDFLEGNPEHSGAAHQSLMAFSEETNQNSRLFREHNITDIEIGHLLDGRLFHTASFIFRSEIIRRNPIPTDITSFDRALFFLIATYGKIHFSKEVMCCYRKHSGGMSNWVTTEMLEKDLNIVPWISRINPKFPKHQYYQFLHLVALSYPPFLTLSKVFIHSILFIYHSLYSKSNKFQDTKIYMLQRLPLFLAKTKQTGGVSKIVLWIRKLFGFLDRFVKKWFSA